MIKKDEVVSFKYKLKYLVSAINEHKITLFLVLDGRGFDGLEAEETNELQSAVVWQNQ